MNLDKAEEFLKSKGVDTEKYVIHDIKGGYNAQIPIALWLTEFAEQQVKNNGVLDDVIKPKDTFIYKICDEEMEINEQCGYENINCPNYTGK